MSVQVSLKTIIAETNLENDWYLYKDGSDGPAIDLNADFKEIKPSTQGVNTSNMEYSKCAAQIVKRQMMRRRIVKKNKQILLSLQVLKTAVN